MVPRPLSCITAKEASIAAPPQSTDGKRNSRVEAGISPSDLFLVIADQELAAAAQPGLSARSQVVAAKFVPEIDPFRVTEMSSR